MKLRPRQRIQSPRWQLTHRRAGREQGHHPPAASPGKPRFRRRLPCARCPSPFGGTPGRRRATGPAVPKRREGPTPRASPPSSPLFRRTRFDSLAFRTDAVFPPLRRNSVLKRREGVLSSGLTLPCDAGHAAWPSVRWLRGACEPTCRKPESRHASVALSRGQDTEFPPPTAPRTAVAGDAAAGRRLRRTRTAGPARDRPSRAEPRGPPEAQARAQGGPATAGSAPCQALCPPALSRDSPGEEPWKRRRAPFDPTSGGVRGEGAGGAPRSVTCCHGGCEGISGRDRRRPALLGQRC